MSHPPSDGGPVTLPSIDRGDPVEVEHALARVSQTLFGSQPQPVKMGRYALLDRIGRGGGGMVYRARDPQLDRSVAVKVVPAPKGNERSEWSEGVWKEAHAIARLSHPHIVAVHDVGRAEPDHPQFPRALYIVMELLEGDSLVRWLEGPPRPWTEVLDALLPIGRALHAAHEAGVIHRDVKPGNLVWGTDGRLRLVDFGLAQSLGPPAADGSEPEPRRTTVLGTPFTMAPEQHQGLRADARTDQYGFCVTLHLALHGVTPFPGNDLESLLLAKLSQAPRKARDVPRWLDEVLARGLVPEREGRFPDMRALLERIEHRRGRRRRRATMGSLTAVFALGTGLTWASQRTAPAVTCIEQGEDRIEQVWGIHARGEALASLADDEAEAVDGVVSDLLGRWRIARRTSCTEAFESSEEPLRATAARLACLDGVLDEIGELSSLLRKADTTVARSAIHTAQSLSAPESCRQLGDVETTKPELELLLRRARLHLQAGMLDSSRQLATEALHRGRAGEDLRAQARAHLLLARLDGKAGRWLEQRRACERAVLTAERAGADRLALEAQTLLLRLLDDPREIELLYRIAEARFEGLPEHERDLQLRAELLVVRGRVHEDAQQLGHAVSAYEEAIRVLERAPGSPIARVPVLNSLGNTNSMLGQLSRARENFTDAIEITRQVWGDEHANNGPLLNNLAGIELALGRPEDALPLLERALVLKTSHAGPSSPVLVSTLQRLAATHVALGHPERASSLARRALAIARAHQREQHGLLAGSQIELAKVAVAADRCDEALVLLREAEQNLSSTAPLRDRLADLFVARARCQSEVADARSAWQHALEHAERAHGAASRAVVDPLVALAALDTREGAHADARARLTRARQICAQTEGDPAQAQRVTRAMAELD